MVISLVERSTPVLREKAPYEVLPRLVALMLMANQRFGYSPFQIRALERARWDIVHADDALSLDERLSARRVIPIKAPTSDGLTLDGVLLVQKGCYKGYIGGIPRVSGRLMAAYPGVGGCYENWYEALKKMVSTFRTSVLMVNYRGVGASGGYVCYPSDLMEDGYAIAQCAHRCLYNPEGRLHLYGTSMGGAVASHVAESLEREGKAPLTVGIDRSYAYLTGVIEEAISFELAKQALRKVVASAGWTIDSVGMVARLKTVQVIVLRAEADRVIPRGASMMTALTETAQKPAGPVAFLSLGIEPLDRRHPSYPYWVDYERRKTTWGSWMLVWEDWRTSWEDFMRGLADHMSPLSAYPGAEKVYKALMDRGEETV